MTDDQAVPPPDDTIDAAAIGAATERVLASGCGLSREVVACLMALGLEAAAPAIRKQALADAHLVPDTLIDETRRDALAEGARNERERIRAEVRNRAASERDEAITARSPSAADRHIRVAAALDAAADLLEGDTDD